MAGTLVSYLPFTRSVTEDLSGKEWTVTGNPQIINRDDFSVPVAKFESNEYLTLNNLTVGGNNHWIMDFWVYIPQTSSDHNIIWLGGDGWFFVILRVLSSGKLRIGQCYNDGLDTYNIRSEDTSNTYFNKWINIKFSYSLYDKDVSAHRAHMHISDGTKWLEEVYIKQKRYYITKTARLEVGPNILLSQFRFYTKTDTFYLADFIPNPPTESGNVNIYLPTRQSFAWNELQVHDTVNFDYMNNINYTTNNKATQWYYKNIGTADGLLVSGTSLTDVDPSKSVTFKAFYQTNRAKCFDTQASKEIYMLFDVYFDGTNRWRAYEESSTNGIIGITAQTSGVLNIFSNGTNVGASIPLTINKLETYLLHMRSDATNGYIEVYKDGEYKYLYIGNVNNGDDFNNLDLQSDGSGTVFSNIVISDQPIYDYDRWTGNYNNIQRALTNETWIPEKCFKVGWPLNNILPINISWTATGNVSTSSDIKKEGTSSIHLPNGAYLVANDIINLNTDKWTFDCWAYLVSSSGENGYFALSARTDGGRYGIIVADDGLWVADVTSGWQAKNESITFPSVKNQWVHLAIVKNDQQVTFYQNGTSVWSFQTTALDNSGKFILGGSNYGYDTDIYFDQVRFVKYTALWTENFIPPTTEDYETYQNSFLSGSLDPTLNIWFPFDQIIPLSFTGQNDSYAKLPLSVLSGETTFTIEVKFSTTSTASYTNNYSWKTIIGCEIQNYWQDDFGLCVNNGKLCFWAEPKTGGSDSSRNTTSNAIVNDGIIHTAAVVSSNGAIDLYCDGQHVAHTDNVNAKITSTYQIGIASNINNPDSSLLMDLYEARFWNVARTQDQIFADIDGTETGLQGWYKPSQNNLLDYSGNNRHATIYNASYDLTNALKSKTLNSTSKDLVTWSISGTSPFITTINELNGKATQFGQGYIYTNPPELKSNNFTIDFWEYVPSTINKLTSVIVSIDGTDGTATQCLYIGYDGSGATVPSFWLGKGASSGWKYSNKIIGTKIRGQWVHRAVVRYNDKIYAFENGNLYTSFDIEAGMYIDVTGSSLFIGGFKRASRLHPGMLSEVRVYVGIALWTENFTPPNQEDYFEIYWYFNKPAPILNTNYDIQRTLTNETWIPAKRLKSYLTTINNSITALRGNQWNTYNNPSVVKTNHLNGKAISFSNAYLEYQNGITLGGKSFTISGWFNMASNTGQWSRVFQLSTMAGTETNTIRIARNGNNQTIVFTFYNATLTGTVIYDISYNTWYHFAFVYDHINSKVYIYINGQRILSGNQTIPATNFTLRLGRSNYWADGYFSGQISEFMIYDDLVLYTENFIPPNQEDYFEIYWCFNKPAPILNTNYNTLRYLTNNSITWKYINPGYNDISPFTYTNSIVTQVQPHNAYTDMQVSGDIAINTDIYQELCIKFDIYLGNTLGTIFSFPYGKGTISISISKPESSTTYLAQITHERNEENPIGTQLSPEASYSDYELGQINEEISFIIYIKSDAYNKGEILIDSSSWIDTDDNRRVALFSTNGRFHLYNANINEGNNLSKTLNVKCIYNLIFSNQQLTFDDIIAHNINPAQRSIINNEEWRIARYFLKSWMMFDKSFIKDLCGHTWTAYGQTSSGTANAIHDTALQLNKGYLRSDAAIEFGGADFTVDFYGYMNSSSEEWAGFFCAQSTTNTGDNGRPGQINLHRNNSSGTIHCNCYNSSGAQLFNQVLSGTLTNGLHHFELDYSHVDSTLRVFIDGQINVTQTVTLERLARYIFFGTNSYNPSTQRMVGTLDEFRLFDGVALHTENFTPPTAEDYAQAKADWEGRFSLIANTERSLTNQALVDESLKVYLPFDRSTTEDLKGNEWTAYGTPNISDANAITGKALQLSGGSYVRCNSVTIGGQDFTIDGWCYFNTTGIGFFSRIFEMSQTDGSNTNNLFFGRYQSSNNFTLGYNGVYFTGAGIWNERFHFEIVYEHAASTIKWYLNGELKSTATNNTVARVARKLRLGKSSWSEDGAFVGSIDEFRIFDGVALHTENFTPPTAEDHLVSWLSFNPLPDLCGNTWTATGSPVIEDNVLKLNGSSYLTMTEKFVFTGQPFTISCKFSATSNTTGGAVCPWQLYIANSNRIQLEIDTSGRLILWKDSDSTIFIKATTNVLDGQEHHTECDFDGSTWYLFLDGNLIGTKNHTCTERTYTLYVGTNYATGRKFTGTIDEFQIYDGMALHTENFTPPVHPVNDKLFYDKPAETMKFEYFADVQKTTWKMTERTSKKILVSYFPFDGDVKDLCDDERVIYRDGSTPVFSSQDSTKNKSLSLSSYDGSSYASRSYEAFFHLLPYDKSGKFIAELDIIANLPGDSFTAESNHINILEIMFDSTTIVNILYWDPENPLGQGATSNVAKLLITNKSYSSNPPDTFIDDYTLTAQSKKSFHVTIIFDDDELDPSTMIFLKPLDGGNSYVYRLIGDNILRYNKDRWMITFGGLYNATNGLNINIDEFKFYLDYTDNTPTTIIDKNIEVRFNNGEESVYFEFYANIDLSKHMIINISPSILCWYYFQENKKLRIQGSQAFIPSESFTSPKGVKDLEYYPSLEQYQFLEDSRTNSNIVYTTEGLSIPPQIDYLPYTLFFWTIAQDTMIDILLDDQYAWSIYPSTNDLEVQNDIDKTSITIARNTASSSDTYIYHLALVLENSEASLYVNGSYVDTLYNLTFNGESSLFNTSSGMSFYGFGAIKGNIFKNGNMNLGYIGCPPSYVINTRDSQVSKPRLALQHNDKIYYNKLVLPTDEKASNIRVYHNDTVYALSK